VRLRRTYMQSPLQEEAERRLRQAQRDEPGNKRALVLDDDDDDVELSADDDDEPPSKRAHNVLDDD
jgi:hypothetical protein